MKYYNLCVLLLALHLSFTSMQAVSPTTSSQRSEYRVRNRCTQLQIWYYRALMACCEGIRLKLENEFLEAAQYGTVEEVKFFLDCGIDINATDLFGRTALMLAARDFRQKEVIAFLLMQPGIDLFNRKAKSLAQIYSLTTPPSIKLPDVPQQLTMPYGTFGVRII